MTNNSPVSSDAYEYLDNVGPEERARLEAVRRYRLVDQPLEDAYDRIAFVAAAIFDTPIATVSLVEQDRVWLAACEGLGGVREVGKEPGLCASVIAQDEVEAREALQSLLVERRYGTERVVVEEHLEGEELSLLALCDGERAVAMAPAQDYKRIFDGDRGPNTGGMGSYSPVPGIGPDEVAEIVRTVHQPVVDTLRGRGMPFHGVLYAGLMLTGAGPKVLEFNVRFGDPETQAVLPRLRSDLLDVLQRATRTGGLADATLQWDDAWAVTVVLASAGYPASSSRGDVIRGLDAVPPGVEVTHAGTAHSDGDVVTAGGRVLNVTALGPDPGAARDAAYAGADMIDFQGKQLRRDIALRAVERVA